MMILVLYFCIGLCIFVPLVKFVALPLLFIVVEIEANADDYRPFKKIGEATNDYEKRMKDWNRRYKRRYVWSLVKNVPFFLILSLLFTVFLLYFVFLFLG